jgi:hypothetical protein
MYVGMRSAYLNCDDFMRPVRGAMKLSRACFGCFECTFPLAWLNNCNWPQQNCRCIVICIESVFNHFHNFRRSALCAIIKIMIAIENCRSLKLCQSRQLGMFVLCRLPLDQQQMRGLQAIT